MCFERKVKCLEGRRYKRLAENDEQRNFSYFKNF